MKATLEKKRRQDLGIFYTKPEVVDFMYDILLLWKEKEDMDAGRWDSHKPKHYPSAIDPACGEGIFLKKAIEKGFTKPEWVFGMDIDEDVVYKWPTISLLEAFDNDMEKLQAHFFHQNGLMPIRWEQHKEKYYGKLKKEDIRNEQFNLVIGNPPYGGIGVDFSTYSPDSVSLLEALGNFRIFAYKSNGKKRNGAPSLFDNYVAEPTAAYSTVNAKTAQSTPIEVLFIERFVRLCKEGDGLPLSFPTEFWQTPTCTT